jgi:hypothetical protein
MRESDLYAPVRDWLKEQGFAPKAEVKDVDIVALKGDTVLAVELKSILNLDVILQAVDRQRISDIVYIGVPKKGRLLFTKRWKMLIHLLKRLELGLLLVTMKGEISLVEEAIKPVEFDRYKSVSQTRKKRENIVKEYDKRKGDYNIGGVNRTKILTAYRESSLMIAYLMSLNGPLSVKKLKELGSDSKKTADIISKNFYGWFEKEDRGVYKLSVKGSDALIDYKSFINIVKASGGSNEA